MEDNDEDEAVNVDAMIIAMNEVDDLIVVDYRGGLIDQWVPFHYNIPEGVPFRLTTHLSVTVIDAYACYGCKTLREVLFHEYVPQIGYSGFQLCSRLQRLELPAGLLRLEAFAFDGCTSLREIVIPASVQFVGRGALNGCTSLERVVFAPTVNVVELGSEMFWGCSNLRFVTLPQNLRSIPARFFKDCTSLTNIRIPPSVEVVEESAFCRSGIQSLVILENVHQIDREVFRDCAFLKKVIIHSTDLNLATDIFRNCPSLTVLMIAPLLWPKLFVSMNGHSEFVFNFFRQYHTKIFDFNQWWIDRNVNHDANEE